MSNSNTIKIFLVNENETGASDSSKEFSVLLNKTFFGIFDDYEKQNNINHNELRYIYRGHLVKGIDTPASLNMKDGATIEVINSKSNYTNKVNKSVKIILSLIDPDGLEHQSEIKIDRKIKDWLKTRCSTLNLNFDSLSFVLNDNIIDVEKTPHQLKLKTNDKIYAHNKINISTIDTNAAKCHDVQTKIYSPPTNTTPLTNSVTDSLINITIKTPNNKTFKTQVNPNETFKHSFKSFLKKRKFDVADYYLLFDNTYINGKDTPAHLQMKDGDIIKLKKKENHHHHEEEPHTPSKTDDSSCLLI